MPRYKITELSFIDNILVQPGTEIESDAIPAAHWEPLDKAASKASKTAAGDEAARIESGRAEADARAARDATDGMPPAPFGEIARLQAEADAAQAAAAEADAKAIETAAAAAAAENAAQ